MVSHENAEVKIASDKPRRFFYHFYKQKGRMSVHFAGACHVVDNIHCFVPCETKWNKRQPKLVMQGFARKLTILYGVAHLE